MAKKKNDPTKININKKNLKATFSSKLFFKHLGQTIVTAADGDFGSAAKSILSIPQSKETTIAQKAFILITKSLGDACRSILTDNEEHQKMLDAIPSLSIKAKGLGKDIEKKLLDLELSLGLNFFTSPHRSSFLKQIQDAYQDWLHQQIGFTSAQSQSLAALLPMNFLYALTNQWSIEPSYYKEIQDFFDNPFFEALHKESGKAEYYSRLQSVYSQPVFSSPEMTLSDIYIEPNFKIYKKCSNTNDDELHLDDDGFYSPEYEDGSLHQYISRLFDGHTPLKIPAEKADFAILLGQPGQGKTSFCYRTIYDLITNDNLQNRNLYFVRLRDITDVPGIISNPLETIRKYLAQSIFEMDHPLAIQELNNSILILDGLDELYMTKGLDNAAIRDFIRNIALTQNSSYKDLKILISTRYNYLNLDELGGEKHLIIKLDELNLSQQLAWLRKYKSIYPTCKLTQATLRLLDKSKEQKYKSIKELITQPILLQMIARAELDITQGSNRSIIYQSLFDIVIERQWSKDKQLNKFKELTEKDLRSFLQTIALSIHQSNFEYIKRSEFENEESLTGKATKKFLKKTQNKLPLDDAIKDILVSFYFKNKKKQAADRDEKDSLNEYAIEFLHKSLQEFLVAENIWQFYKVKFLQKDDDNEYFIDDWKAALTQISPITSAKILSPEITTYLIEIIKNDEDEVKKSELTKRMINFLPGLLKRDFLLSYQANQRNTYPIRQALANFYSYWTILSHTKKKEDKIEGLKGDFLSLLKNLNILYPNSFINLSGADLSGADLSGANLSGANLKRANLRGTDLRDANLREERRADLKRTNKSSDTVESDLGLLFLIPADLQGADLSDANLYRTNLPLANLSEANLHETDLTHADLPGTDLRKAKNLKFEQLLQASNLKDCIGLPAQLESDLRSIKPDLFE